MTREQAKELLPIIQAFAEGEIIQYKNFLDEWEDIKENEGLSFICPPSDYRIKSQQKYRPFESQEECWSEMQEHTNFGWLRRNETGACVNISAVFSHAIMFGDEEYGYKKAFECYTFADGTPFGIREK